MDPALEVPVGGCDGCDHQVVGPDGVGDLVGQRSGVPDARHAAVSADLEPELLQVHEEAGVLQVLGDDPGPGGQGGLDVVLRPQAEVGGLLGHQAGGDHDRGVGGVGARGDGRDDQGAVPELPGDGGPLLLHAQGLQGVREGLLHGGHGDEVLRPLVPGEAGDHGGQVELQGVGVLRVLGVPEALLLAVLLDGVDVLLGPAGQAEVLDRLPVHGAEPGGGAVLGAHVGQRGAVGQVQVPVPLAVVLHELADDALLPEHVDHGQHEVGGVYALPELPGQLEPDHVGQLHVAGLADHGGLGLDPADAPSEDAESVDLGGVGVRSEAGVRICDLNAVRFLDVHEGGQVLQVDLVADPVSRGHGAEVLQALLGPLEQGVALLVPLEVQLLVELLGVVPPGVVRVDGVVDDEVHGHQGVDELGVLAHGGHGGPHAGQVRDDGSAGQVLQQDPGGDPRDVLVRVLDGVPGCGGDDVVVGDGGSVALPEHALDEDLDGVGDLGEVLDDSFRLQLAEAVYRDVALCGGEGLRARSDFCHERVLLSPG